MTTILLDLYMNPLNLEKRIDREKYHLLFSPLDDIIGVSSMVLSQLDSRRLVAEEKPLGKAQKETRLFLGSQAESKE